MANADNEALVRQLFEAAWNRGDLDAVDELVAADAVPAHGASEPGPASWKQQVAFFRSSFGGLRYTIDDLFSADDKVVARWTATGTDSVGFMGKPATGVHASVTGITIYRLADGKLVEHWDEWDLAGLIQKLEAAPAAAAR